MTSEPGFWLFAANAMAWLIIQIGVGFACSRLSHKRIDAYARLLRMRAWERNGAIYQRVFRVKKWKSLLPSGAALFSGTFSLKRIGSQEISYLEEWVIESYRAELTHWVAMPPIVLFMIWNPPIGFVVNIVYVVLANLPCIIVQRYNRPRLLAIIEKKANLDSDKSPRHDKSS